MPEYYVGTLSGTSADGIDVVLVDFAEAKPRLVAARTYPMPDAVRSEVRALSIPTDNEIERLGRLDVTLGRLIGDSVNTLLAEAGVAHGKVLAVGSHGQTLRHRPDADPPFTLQVGDPNTIAARTGIPTVADFRRMDMALGGQGAPLAPLFHAMAFRAPSVDRAVVNLGGIANVTLLPREETRPVTGFDTGPANCLLDEWSAQHLDAMYDEDGRWAASGEVIQPLLETLLGDPYFERPAPKSTGREVFDRHWLEERVRTTGARPEDVQATLLELSCRTIARALKASLPDCMEVIACGGGVRNARFMERLAEHVAPAKLGDTGSLGIDPEWVEGCAFAWLGKMRLKGTPAPASSVTGADGDAPLGAIYLPG
jgi:anhydro-N-acetylmuramic acid kinase